MFPVTQLTLVNLVISTVFPNLQDIISTKKMEIGWVFSQNVYGNVLLHCQLGHSRSACMAVYFLMKV